VARKLRKQREERHGDKSTTDGSGALGDTLMGPKGFGLSVGDDSDCDPDSDRATIVKSGVMGLCGHVFGARVGRHWGHDTPVSESWMAR
jgi:hypothetical protein